MRIKSPYSSEYGDYLRSRQDFVSLSDYSFTSLTPSSLSLAVWGSTCWAVWR